MFALSALLAAHLQAAEKPKKNEAEELPTMVITASRTAQDQKKVPQSTNVVEQKRIERYQATSPSEMLQEQPGARVLICADDDSFSAGNPGITCASAAAMEVGGAYVAEDLDACAQRARILLVGLTAGIRGDLNLALFLRKRVTLIGTVLRARPLEEKIQAAQVLERHLVPWLSRGIVKPVIDRVFPFEQANEALDYLAQGRAKGKVVVQLR